MNARREDLPEDARKQEARDMNRDPISKAPGAHPLGVGVGTAGGAVAGAAVGTFFGPIGTLVGLAVGGIAGAAAGKGVAERIDPTAEQEYWRQAHADRPYVEAHREKGYDYDRDYAGAYAFGLQAREADLERDWDDSLEGDLGRDWENARGESRLSWDEARPAVRDSWDRADETYRTYDVADRYHEARHAEADYYDSAYGYEDYRPAYRYGVEAGSRYGDRAWDDELEADLGRDWETRRGDSRLSWDQAKGAARDAFSSRGSYNSYTDPEYSRGSYHSNAAASDPLTVGTNTDPRR